MDARIPMGGAAVSPPRTRNGASPGELIGALALLLAVLAAPRAAGADSARFRAMLRLDRVDLSRAPQVRTYLTELDNQGRAVTKRSKQSLRLLVDGFPQNEAISVQRFADLGEPITLVFAIQVSPAMSEVLKDAVGAAKRLAASLPKASLAAMVAYADVTTQQTKLADPMKIMGHLDALKIRKEGIELDLPGGVRDALEMLGDPKLPRRRVVVVFSDGISRKIDFKVFTGIARDARDHGIAIFTVGHNTLEPDRLDTLKKLSTGSSGTFRLADNSAEITAAFEAIQEELENELIVTYDVAQLFDGKVHDFQIDAGDAASEPILQAELPKLKDQDRALWGKPWVLAGLAGLGVTGATVFLVLLWRWRVVRSRSLAQSRVPRRVDRDEDEDEDEDEDKEADREDEEEEEEEGEGRPRPRSRRADEEQGPRAKRLATSIGAGGKEAIEGLFASRAPAGDAMGPRAAVWPGGGRAVGEDSEPDALLDTNPERRALLSQVPRSPIPPVAPFAPYSGPAMGQPPELPASAPVGPFHLPLPNPEDFLRQKAPAVFSTDLPAAAAPEAHAQGPRPPGAAPLPGASVGSSAVAGTGIPLAPGTDLAFLPVSLAAPDEQPSAAGFVYRKTEVISLGELVGASFVAWLVPLDGARFETLLLRDGFTLGSDPQCDLQVVADGVQPHHAILHRTTDGYSLMPPDRDQEAFIPRLRDNDRFRIGSMEFLYKTASWLPQSHPGNLSLTVLDGMDQGRGVDMVEGVTYSIGAHSSCALVVRGEGVGSRHALALRKERKCLVVDLGTEGRVQYQGEVVGRQVLTSGQEVTLGKVRLLFQL